MPSILFICTANQFRSPLAAASLQDYVLRNENSANWKIESAGTWTTNGRPALPVTIQNAERLGLPRLDKHLSRLVTADILKAFDLIIVMEAGQKEALNVEFREVRGRVFMLTEVVSEVIDDIPDPIVLGLPADTIATDLNGLIQTGAEKILELAKTISSKGNRS